MSFYILHILTPHSFVGVDKGCLTLKVNEEEKRLPLNEISVVIVAAKGVAFSSSAIAKLIENNSVIVHCNEKYIPIGQTLPLERTIDIKVLENQLAHDEIFFQKLWNKIISNKIKNQNELLKAIGYKSEIILFDNNFDESFFSKRYWKLYFSQFGKDRPKIREHKNAKSPINIMLNYAYAIINSIVHRSIVAHGLLPTIGIHHKFRFWANPLTYDLMEPFRPICDAMLLKFYKEKQTTDLGEWAKEVAKNIISLKISDQNGKEIKLIYWTDIFVEKIVECFKQKDEKKYLELETDFGKILYGTGE